MGRREAARLAGYSPKNSPTTAVIVIPSAIDQGSTRAGTGVSDETPVDKQLELLLQLIPAGSTVGVAYCSSEVNSQVQVNNALAYLDSVGVPYETGTVTNVNEAPAITSGANGSVWATFLSSTQLPAAAARLTRACSFILAVYSMAFSYRHNDRFVRC